MKCERCGSELVTVRLLQSGGKTRKKGNGFGGNLNNFLRFCMAFCTFGISNIFWKKSTGNEKMSFDIKKMCMCQKCGHVWEGK